MRKTMIVLLTISFIAAVTTQAHAWPWSKKTAKPAGKRLTQAVQPTSQEGTSLKTMPKIIIPQIPKMPEMPKFVMPTSTSAPTQEGTAGKAPEPGKAEGQAPAPMMRFGMASGELVSVNDKDPDNIEVKIKTQEGEELTVIAPPQLDIIKRIKITDLKPGEKLTLHYLANEETKSNNAIYIATGEMPQFNIPMQLPQAMRVKPPEKPQEGEKKK